MATRRHVHGTVRHVELVRARSLHRHMVRSFGKKSGERREGSTLSTIKQANINTESQN